MVSATGTMGYEVMDACDGWAVRQRLSMRLTNSDGQDIEMVSDYATWEAKDGLKFRRPIKLALTCGEEGGGQANGASWLVQNRRDLIDAAFAHHEYNAAVATYKQKHPNG